MDFGLIKVDWLIIWAVNYMDFVNEFKYLNFEEASE